MIEGRSFSDIKADVHDRVTAIRVACELEVLAPKLGNVHPLAEFHDCSVHDFLAAARQIAPALASEQMQAVLGERVLTAVQKTREVTQANVNLGIILLIAPLAMSDSRQDVAGIIESLTADDGARVFEAIRLASPGGMKRDDVSPEQDVQRAQLHAIDLVAAMSQAADRDRIALQYATGFADFFDDVLPSVAHELSEPIAATQAVVKAQLRLLAGANDSLILRKCGTAIAEETRRRANECLKLDTEEARQDFDQWLRADGNRRNPGTTADLIAAAIYWLLAS
jgi:triphosphoribosyl-dephospho-CoA synthase